MKIEITETMKSILTIAEIPAIEAIQKEFKFEKFEWEAAMAASIASDNTVVNVLKVSAEIAKNCRISNYYGNSEYSGDLDIWLNVLAYDSYYGFYDIGAYLSDIWSANGENREEIKSHMYIRAFTERK